MSVLHRMIPSGYRPRTAAGAFVALAIGCVLSGSAQGLPPAPPAASFTATDFAWNVTGGTATSVHIDPGQSVAFSYPTGISNHNVDFGALAPTSCTQDSGADSGAVPPLPHTFTVAPWSGTCTFNNDQTYQFHCDLHAWMQGTIVVGNGGPGSGAGGGGGGAGGGGGTSSNTLSGDSLRIAKVQHSARVRGSAAVAVSDSKLLIEVFTRSKPRRIGRVSKRSLPAGRVAFSVLLNKSGRAELTRRRRLAVRVKLSLTDLGGATVRASRSIVLKLPSGG